MLVIGVLMGTTLVMVWNSRGGGGGMQYDSSTPTGAEVKNTTPGVTETSSIAPSSLSFPLPPSVPANTRVGLSVPDQPRGTMVEVGNLLIIGTKWVAIYDDHDGKPGWILGASRVHEGDEKTTIELLRQEGTTPGATYYAAILNDDGDEEFNRLTDLPPLSSEKVTIVRFTAR